MTTKEYLMQISRMDSNINNTLSEIDSYKRLMYGLKAITNGDRVQSTPDFDKIGASVAKVVDMETKLDELIDKYVDKKHTIVTQIGQIENELQYNILYARYVEKKNFEKIADEQHISFRHATRVHGMALCEFEKKFGYLYQ